MKSLATILLFSIAFPVAAETIQDCHKDQLSMNKCAAKNKNDAQKVYSEVLARLSNILPSEEYNELLKAESAWKIVVDTDCSIKEWWVRGGSARGMVSSNCQASRIRQRTNNLIELMCHPMIECDLAEKHQTSK